MLVTQEDALAKKSARLRNYGQSVRYRHPDLGINSRLDEIHAAMLSVRLQWLHAFTQRRREITDAYRSSMKNAAVTLLGAPEEPLAHVHHLFVVTSGGRESLQAHMQTCGVQALIHYPIPVHLQDPCLDVLRDPEGLTHTERHADTCLSLPCHPQMSDDDVQTVIDAINTFVHR